MKKSFIALLVLTVLSVSSLTVFAATFSDVSSSHWAQKSIARLADENIVNGDGNGTYRPEDEVSRVEFVTMLMRVFEPEEKADLSSYKDVNPKAWYYDALSKAIAMSAITGDSDSSMRPEDSITRQEAMVVINRIMELEASKGSDLRKFSDYKKVASWAEYAVTALTEAGYVNGYEDGTIRPEGYVTRAEVAKLLDGMIGMIISDAGEYDLKDVEGIVVVKAKGVSLTNTADVDKIFVLNDDVKDSLKLDGKKAAAKDVTVINPTEKKSSGGGAGGITTTVAIIEVEEDENGLYTFDKTGLVGNGKRIKFIDINGNEQTKVLSKDTYEEILDSLLKDLDEDKLAKTLATKYNDKAIVQKMADRMWEKVTGQTRVDAKEAGNPDDRYNAMYEVYQVLKLADVDVVALAKSVIDYDADIDAVLALAE